jgi:hypothetical protein
MDPVQDFTTDMDPVQVFTKAVVHAVFANLKQTNFGSNPIVAGLLTTGNPITESEIPVFVPAIETALSKFGIKLRRGRH